MRAPPKLEPMNKNDNDVITAFITRYCLVFLYDKVKYKLQKLLKTSILIVNNLCKLLLIGQNDRLVSCEVSFFPFLKAKNQLVQKLTPRK